MDITYLGHSSFKLKGKQVTVITDPFNEDTVGLKIPKNLSADIVTVSHEHEDHNASKLISGNPYIIHGPGEYEIKGTAIYGMGVYHDSQKGAQRGKNTMYKFKIDEMNILHAGDLGHTLSDAQLDEVGSIDILLIPVGGIYTIDAKSATNVVHEIDPAIVIPMHFGRPDLNQSTFAKLSPLEVFLKEVGKPDVQKQTKLTINKDKLPEEMQVVVLS